jgi:6-phosphogluconolactonase (cycloisomerase 2 family)
MLRFSANIARSFTLKPSAKTMQVLSDKTQKVTPFLHGKMHGKMHKIDTKRHA